MEKNKLPNPLDYITRAEIVELGLLPEDIEAAYQPSGGGVFHARGAESTGKTLLCAHRIRNLIDNEGYTPSDLVSNLSFKGKYREGSTLLKGDDLQQFLWDMTHKPYRGKIIFIDEIDSEFPARSFADKDQTEIALRLWHIHKLHNYVFLTSHLGNSTDVIIHLASHYILIPHIPNFITNSMDFTIINNLDLEVTNWLAVDIIKTMLIYNRQELTEDMNSENRKLRTSELKQIKERQKQTIKQIKNDINFNEEGEWEGLSIIR